MFFQVDGDFIINTQQVVSIVKDTKNCALKIKMSNGEIFFSHAFNKEALNRDLDLLLNSS